MGRGVHCEGVLVSGCNGFKKQTGAVGLRIACCIQPTSNLCACVCPLWHFSFLFLSWWFVRLRVLHSTQSTVATVRVVSQSAFSSFSLSAPSSSLSPEMRLRHCLRRALATAAAADRAPFVVSTPIFYVNGRTSLPGPYLACPGAARRCCAAGNRDLRRSFFFLRVFSIYLFIFDF